MSNFAIIDKTGLVINVAEWDGISPWIPPDGTTAVAVSAGVPVSPGWTFLAGVFNAPLSTPPALVFSPSSSLLDQLAIELGITTAQLTTALQKAAAATSVGPV